MPPAEAPAGTISDDSDAVTAPDAEAADAVADDPGVICAVMLPLATVVIDPPDSAAPVRHRHGPIMPAEPAIVFANPIAPDEASSGKRRSAVALAPGPPAGIAAGSPDRAADIAVADGGAPLERAAGEAAPRLAANRPVLAGPGIAPATAPIPPIVLAPPAAASSPGSRSAAAPAAALAPITVLAEVESRRAKSHGALPSPPALLSTAPPGPAPLAAAAAAERSSLVGDEAGDAGIDTQQLGGIAIGVGGEASATRVHFAVERHATALLLADAGPQLERALAAVGGRLDSLTVDVRDGGGRRDQSPDGSNPQPHGQQRRTQPAPPVLPVHGPLRRDRFA